MDQIIQMIDQLALNHQLNNQDLLYLLSLYQNDQVRELLANKARQVCNAVYGKDIYIRGLIEISNYCHNDCYYCGIRCSNHHLSRYRLTKDDIIACAKQGYRLGFRTFVLQGGEDGYYHDDLMGDIISELHHLYPDCAITLSLGEKTKATYQKYYDSHASRYLLRHETANQQHYRLLHPKTMSLKKRKQCLFDLKEIGFQVGCGIMVGSYQQTLAHIVEDINFMQQLQPQMIGIGPFIPHHQTPFAKQPSGSLELTLMLLSILRLIFPNALIPSTTALATIHPQGRKWGILAGANVIMPNISPLAVRKKYELYDDKACMNEEAGESIQLLKQEMSNIGYQIVVDRGDYKGNEE